jgi:TPP-dependent pyruvate/acetoin dehydrogenase alpha subunit
MTEEQKTAQEQANATSEGMPWAEMMSQMCGEGEGCCAGMMERMMSDEGEGCCGGMMGKMMSQQGQGGWGEMMSQVLTMFAGMKGKTEEKAAADETK